MWLEIAGFLHPNGRQPLVHAEGVGGLGGGGGCWSVSSWRAAVSTNQTTKNRHPDFLVVDGFFSPHPPPPCPSPSMQKKKTTTENAIGRESSSSMYSDDWVTDSCVERIGTCWCCQHLPLRLVGVSFLADGRRASSRMTEQEALLDSSRTGCRHSCFCFCCQRVPVNRHTSKNPNQKKKTFLFKTRCQAAESGCHAEDSN